MSPQFCIYLSIWCSVACLYLVIPILLHLVPAWHLQTIHFCHLYSLVCYTSKLQISACFLIVLWFFFICSPYRLWHDCVLFSLSMTLLFIIRFYSTGPAGLPHIEFSSSVHILMLTVTEVFCSAASCVSVLLAVFSWWLLDCYYASECWPALHLNYSPWQSWWRLSWLFQCPVVSCVYH